MAIVDSITRMFHGLSGNTVLGKTVIASGALLTSYFAPIVGLLVACFACSAVDMVYGIKVAKMQDQKITSKRNWKGTLIKIRDEFTLILLSHLIEFVILGESTIFVLSGGIAVIIMLTELWSILENLNTINPKGPWRSLGKFLKKKGEDYIGMDIDLGDKEYVSTDTAATEE